MFTCTRRKTRATRGAVCSRAEKCKIFLWTSEQTLVGVFFGSRFIVQRQYVTMLHITRVERLVGCQLGTPFRDSKE